MGGQKTTSTNDYGFFQKPTWQGLQDFQAWRPERDPGIAPRFNRQRQDFIGSFNAPTGAYATPELTANMMRAGLEGIGQQEGQAYRDEMFDYNKQRGGQLGQIAVLTAPECAQTKRTQKTGGGLGGFLGGLLTTGLSFI